MSTFTYTDRRYLKLPRRCWMTLRWHMWMPWVLGYTIDKRECARCRAYQLRDPR